MEQVVFTSIRSDATRLAALTSGEVDMVLDPPFQDVERLKTDGKLQITTTGDIGTQYFTFDQARDELLYGDVKDKNPFKDIRVRKAVAHALNMDLIIQKVLRGQATPTGSLVSPRVDGYDKDLDKRIPYDPARAKALLAEAGYPNGFGVTLDCVNVGYREAVCQAAAAMLTQVGIRVQVRSSPTNTFFPRLSTANASFVEYGWTAAPDPWTTLNGLFRTFDSERPGHLQRRPLQQPQARRVDRRRAHRARSHQAPRARRRGAAHAARRRGLHPAVPPPPELGDEEQRVGHDVAQRHDRAALGEGAMTRHSNSLVGPLMAFHAKCPPVMYFASNPALRSVAAVSQPM